MRRDIWAKQIVGCKDPTQWKSKFNSIDSLAQEKLDAMTDRAIIELIRARVEREQHKGEEEAAEVSGKTNLAATVAQREKLDSTDDAD